ncbi:MAG: alkaline phosphatase family protein [Ktedonobacterales bacterium]
MDINGVMVSGHPSPSRAGAHVRPAALTGTIPTMVEPATFPSTPARLDSMLSEIDVTTRIVERCLADEHYDCFMVVFQQSDQAHHLFWRYIDRQSPVYRDEDAAAYGDYIAKVYERLDVALGQLLDIARPERVLVVSDHGGARSPAVDFHVNTWLARQGYLTLNAQRETPGRKLYALRRRLLSRGQRIALRGYLERVLPRRMRGQMERFILNVTAVDWERTRVYRFPLPEHTEGLVINLRGRQPHGTVDVGAEYHQLRAQLIEELRALRTPDGLPLAAAVWTREELFSGPHTDMWPDIIYKLHPDYEGGPGITGELFSPAPLDTFERHSGTHDARGILAAWGDGIQRGATIEDARLLDVAPTLYRALEVPVPPHLEGRVLNELFAERADVRAPAAEPATVASGGHGRTHEERAPVFMPVARPTGAQENNLSAEDEDSIRERLTALGYL